MKLANEVKKLVENIYPDGHVEKAIKVRERMNQLYKHPTSKLKEIVGRSYRVVDLKGTDKHSLVSMALEAEFGRGYYNKYLKKG
jgi:hypothetical protein